jgi:hypothetical protein
MRAAPDHKCSGQPGLNWLFQSLAFRDGLFQPLASSATGFFSHWLLPPLAFAATSFFSHWLLQPLASSATGFFSHWLLQPLACAANVSHAAWWRCNCAARLHGLCGKRHGAGTVVAVPIVRPMAGHKMGS